MHNTAIFSIEGESKAMSLSKHLSLSTSHIGYNENLMTYIFLQLPVKSVLKCKCVCKHWHSMASDPLFCHQHASLHGRNLSSSGLVFKSSIDNSSDIEFCSLAGIHNNKNSTSSSIVSFDYLNAPGNRNLSLVSSCNGLFLFQSSNSSDLLEYHVCNPTTKKSFRLALPDYLTRHARMDTTLAFDPCVSPHYKVVFLWRDLEGRYCISMYSSETKSYGKVSVPSVFNAASVVKSSGTFCNGRIHWLVINDRTSFCFDVEEGCLNAFQLPPFFLLCRPPHFFGASQGRLHLVCLGHSPGDTFVYELNEDYSGWFVKYQLGFRHNKLSLCYFCEEQDEGSMLLQLDGSGRIETYNLKEKTTNEVCQLNPLLNNHDLYSRFHQVYEIYQWFPVAYQWIETLSCV